MSDLISKKELLKRYGISYGALYRWKRLGLIPESWFIKKSAVTGQETFFEKEQICQRVELILHRKDGVSLEELADELAGKCNSQRSKRRLVLENHFECREFPIEDLKQAVLTDGERKISILEYLSEVSL